MNDLFATSDTLSVPYRILKGRLITNQRNLLYMLAAGMVMSPKGFREKYYEDTLASFPGWIPLFTEKIPQKALDQSLGERRHLFPCAIMIDLKNLHGLLMAVDINGHAREIQFPNELDGSEMVLLVPAPLPVTWIESIAFPSKENKTSCEVDARDFENVPLLDFNREVNARLFTATSSFSWPPRNVILSDRDSAPDKSFAAGGMMAMLLQMGNRGNMATHACRLGFDPDATDAPGDTDPMIRDLGTWLQTGTTPVTADISSNLFWGAVDSVVRGHSAVDTRNPIDVVLEYLEGAGEKLDERMKQALSRLAGDLRKLAGFSDSTITELFEKHPKPFSRVMALFFLREKCSDLIEFRHPLLTEVDYVAAAILFAARDGWLGLPLGLRDVNGLQAAVSHRMAAMDHHLSATGLDFGEPPERPMPLREIFLSDAKGWTLKQQGAALLLARESKWTECIHTRINLGKGNYRMVIDGGGVQILLPGEVKAVVTEADPSKLINKIENTEISPKSEKRVRSFLNK